MVEWRRIEERPTDFPFILPPSKDAGRGLAKQIVDGVGKWCGPCGHDDAKRGGTSHTINITVNVGHIRAVVAVTIEGNVRGISFPDPDDNP